MGERQYKDDSYEEWESYPREQDPRIASSGKGDTLPHEEEESHTMKQLKAVGINPRFVTDDLDDNAQLIVNQLLYKLNQSQLDLDHEKAQHELTKRQIQSHPRKRVASTGEGESSALRPHKRTGQHPPQTMGDTTPFRLQQGSRPVQHRGESTPQFLSPHYSHRPVSQRDRPPALPSASKTGPTARSSRSAPASVVASQSISAEPSSSSVSWGDSPLLSSLGGSHWDLSQPEDAEMGEAQTVNDGYDPAFMAEVPGPIAPDPVVTLDTVKGHPNPPGYRSDESFSDDEDDPDADVAKLACVKEIKEEGLPQLCWLSS